MFGNDLQTRRLNALQKLVEAQQQVLDALLETAAETKRRLDAAAQAAATSADAVEFMGSEILRALRGAGVAVAAVVALGKYLEATKVMAPGAAIAIRDCLKRDLPDFVADAAGVFSLIESWAEENPARGLR